MYIDLCIYGEGEAGAWVGKREGAVPRNVCVCTCIYASVFVQVWVCVDVQMHSDTAAYVLVFTCV